LEFNRHEKTALIICIISAVCIAASLILPLITADAPALGIIGGADTPTYLLFYNIYGYSWLTLLGAVGLAVFAVLWIKSRKA